MVRRATEPETEEEKKAREEAIARHRARFSEEPTSSKGKGKGKGKKGKEPAWAAENPNRRVRIHENHLKRKVKQAVKIRDRMGVPIPEYLEDFSEPGGVPSGSGSRKSASASDRHTRELEASQ